MKLFAVSGIWSTKSSTLILPSEVSRSAVGFAMMARTVAPLASPLPAQFAQRVLRHAVRVAHLGARSIHELEGAHRLLERGERLFRARLGPREIARHLDDLELALRVLALHPLDRSFELRDAV